MPHIGDRVRHPKFGTGTVLEVNATTALVEWDTYRRTVQFGPPGQPPPPKQRSHVNLNTLTVIMTIAPE